MHAYPSCAFHKPASAASAAADARRPLCLSWAVVRWFGGKAFTATQLQCPNAPHCKDTCVLVLTVECDEVSCGVYEVHDDGVVHQVVSITVTSLVEVHPGRAQHDTAQHSTPVSFTVTSLMGVHPGKECHVRA